ncbi:MAG: glycosyltransferase [Spirochaetales bacterium]|nr:glycosyltransferase [Spirochaetales bacterium]
MSNTIGVVVIGRNEGERLRKCLQSIKDNRVDRFVYVDSGSTDNSLEIAENQGAHIVHLNTDIPFSAGRARNEGFRYLTEQYNDLEYVQFVDGDCMIESNWMDAGLAYLNENPDYVIVAGQRKELFPDSSVYNMMCDYEWNTPIGDAKASGGDFIIRTEAFSEVNGFNPKVVAGEEPDLCYRLRQKGWRIRRIDHIMTYHDAAMTKFSQWWKRTKRSGHAYTQGYDLHKADKEGYNKKEVIRIMQWSVVLPFVVLLGTAFIHFLFVVALMLYPVRLFRIYHNLSKKYGKGRNTFINSWFVSLAVFPQMVGLALYYYRKLRSRDMKIIEYS